ncbi:MAG: glutathione synthase [Thermodesulfobacteriota bacterium]
MKKLKVAFLMDPLEGVKIHKDTTYVFMTEAHRRGHSIYHLLPHDLFAEREGIMGRIRKVEVEEGERWYCFGTSETVDLREMDAIIMREDPPFDMEYLYSTHLLGLIERDVFVMNSPRGIREANEKLYSLNFPEVIPDCLVTNEIEQLRAFLKDVGGRMVVKPLDSCSGRGVFALFEGDKNMSAILEMATNYGERQIIAQRYLPEIKEGDKRLILLDGEPIGAVSRVPRDDEHRGNIHVGARCEKAPVTDRDRHIAGVVSERLKEDGLHFVGLDVIGGVVTEINVTSPTGVQEINRLDGVKLEEQVVDFIEKRAG